MAIRFIGNKIHGIVQRFKRLQRKCYEHERSPDDLRYRRREADASAARTPQRAGRLVALDARGTVPRGVLPELRSADRGRPAARARVPAAALSGGQIA